MKTTMVPLLNLLVTALSLSAASAICDNSGSTIVKIGTKKRKCGSIPINSSLCKKRDGITKKLVGKVCAKQCPLISKCPTGPTAPVSTPVQAPTSSGGPVPPGPYITVSNSSEVVKIPRPPAPTLGPVTGCPHTEANLKLWHSASTWPGGIPSKDGQAVTIPAGTKVLIEQSVVPKLGVVTIPKGSELIIGSNVDGITLDVSGMNVFGKLTAGSKTCRITTDITITLHGSRPTDATVNVRSPEYKGISVEGGFLSLHGERYYNTWTRLGKTVKAGDTALVLQEKVNWLPGQEIVLVTASLKDSRDFNQNEVLTIKSINSSPPTGIGSIVYVTKPVKFLHTANLNYQVEVGLLTRKIKIQGDTLSVPTDPDPGTCTDIDSGKPWTWYFNTTQPCMDKELTGYGGHVMIHKGGIGQVAGVEFYRMGQTNVKARYPMHFHLLGNCPSCFITDSSFHKSYYRCVAVHGTNNSTTSENVAYDITGYCYYLEDGVEENNIISYNLAAHIHTIGPDLVRIPGTRTKTYTESDKLTNPADVTAGGFYITNLYNRIIGNAASGGWSGFVFPSLPLALDTFKNTLYRPVNQPSLVIDGNTAHSSAWWWRDAGVFYFGGALYYINDKLSYNPGQNKESRRTTCKINACFAPINNCDLCFKEYSSQIRITNTKSFLSSSIGFQSWAGDFDIIGYEAHDIGIALQAISGGFWMDKMLTVCRTGSDLGLPSKNPGTLRGTGLIWYDVNQKHIFTNTVWRNCGYRSAEFNQYDTSPSRGCNEDDKAGCSDLSTVFGLLTFADTFSPQIMQATKNVTFENCGRRFRLDNEGQGTSDTVAGRNQNWLDADGTVSGFGVPSYVVSGLWSTKDWWSLDDEAVFDPQGPMRFVKMSNGPHRSVAYFEMVWDQALKDKAGIETCTIPTADPCPWEGFLRHKGKKFSPLVNPGKVNNGYPVTAKGTIVGPTGGFGWILNFNKTSPRSIRFGSVEMDPSSTLLLSIPYPVGTKFDLVAVATPCFNSTTHTCAERFTQVSSIESVRTGKGNTYHVDAGGVLTFRLAQFANQYTGNPTWSLPDYTTPSKIPKDVYALFRFEAGGVRLPRPHGGNNFYVNAKCPSDGPTAPKDGYCTEKVSSYDPDVCSSGYVQVAYDTCCQASDLKKCVFADGSKNF